MTSVVVLSLQDRMSCQRIFHGSHGTIYGRCERSIVQEIYHEAYQVLAMCSNPDSELQDSLSRFLVMKELCYWLDV